MIGTKTTHTNQASGTKAQRLDPESARREPERRHSDYAGIPAQAAKPTATSQRQSVNEARDSYFPHAADHAEDSYPPEMTESSVGATIRLVHRYLELKDIVALWSDFRQGVLPHCEQTDWISAYYASEITRSCNFVRRAYRELQQLRSCGFGTEQPQTLETEISGVLARIDTWMSENAQQQTAPRARNPRSGPGTAKVQRSSPGPSNYCGDAAQDPKPTSNGNSMTLAIHKTENRSGPSPNASRPSSSHKASKEASTNGQMILRSQMPTKDEMLAHIRQTINCMDCVSNSVRLCKLTREQMETGISEMRRELLESQAQWVLDMKQDAELAKVQQMGNVQPARGQRVS